MTERFLSVTEVARLLGVSQQAVTQANLPEPDVLIGRTRGWRRETIEAWIPTRPGRGVGGGRPRMKTGDAAVG